MLRALPLLRPWLTVDGDLKRWFRHPDVRLAFSSQSKYRGMSPFKCPSLFTIVAHVEYGHGVFHPTGGCNAIPAAMARVAREMGVDIRLSEPIEELLFDGRRAVGARTAQGTYPADAVLVNAEFANAMTKLAPDRLRRRWTDAKIFRAPTALFFALQILPPEASSVSGRGNGRGELVPPRATALPRSAPGQR